MLFLLEIAEVWNQASKLQIAHGDFLTFRVQDKDGLKG